MTLIRRSFPEILSMIKKCPKKGCWLWQGHINHHGYSRIHCSEEHKKDYPDYQMQGHRYFYEVYKGKISKGLMIDHLCRVRNCVNPDHLEPVTPKENVHRGYNVQKTHCKNGHPFSGENLYINKHGKRNCRECNRKKVLKCYYKKKAENAM